MVADDGYYVEINEHLERSGCEYVSGDDADSPEEAIKIVEGRIRDGELADELNVASRSVSYSVTHS